MKKCKNILLAGLCLCSVLLTGGCSISFDFSFGNSSASRPQGSSLFGNSSYSDFSEFSENSLDNASRLDELEKKFVYYPTSVRNTLNDEEQELYRRIVSRIENGDLTFEFEDLSNDVFKAAYYAVLYDHPEYFWLGRNYTYTTSTRGDYTKILVEPSLFSDDAAVIKKARESLEQTVKKITAGAAQEKDLYHKVKYVHDYIIDNTVYDMAALTAINEGTEDGTLHAATVYGCLVEQKAVCSGYAAAFQLVMQRLGIECGRINGVRFAESDAHQWNFVCLDDEYYYIDVTWDDPVKKDGTQTRTYEYFLITDTDLARTHTKDDDLPAPVCSGTKYNFYVYNDLYFEEYDFAYIQMAADKMAADSALTVKFSSEEILEQAKTDLIDNQRIFSIGYIQGSISYSVSSSGCILNISY